MQGTMNLLLLALAIVVAVVGVICVGIANEIDF
jgi:hypothetical protein